MFDASHGDLQGAKSRKGATSKALMLNAGVDLLIAGGREAATVSAICDRTGIARTSFYNYFENIEAFWAKIEEEAGRRLAEAVHESVAAMPRGLARLSACLSHLFERAAAEPQWGLLVVEISRRAESPAKKFAEEVAQELMAAISNGESQLHAAELPLAMEVLAAATLRMMSAFAQGEFPRSSARRAAAFCVHGISAPQ